MTCLLKLLQAGHYYGLTTIIVTKRKEVKQKMKISEPTLMQLLQVRLNEAAGILTNIKRVRRASADRLLIDLYSGEAITLTLTSQGIELKGEVHSCISRIYT